MSGRWTDGQDMLLGTLVGMSDQEAAVRVSLIGPDRTAQAVQLRRHKLRLPTFAGRLRWSAEHVATLTTMWEAGATPSTIAGKLGEGFAAQTVLSKVCHLKLRRPAYMKAPPVAPARPLVVAAKLVIALPKAIPGDQYEREFVAAKRAQRVSWAHIARMLGRPEIDLRGRYAR